MTSARYVWNTWLPDAECLVQSVRSVVGLGVDPAHCIIGDRVGKELEEEHWRQLAALGVRARLVNAYTRRNTYADKIARLTLITRHEAEWCVNLDSDTVVNSFRPHQEAAAVEGLVAAAPSWPGCPFAGCASLYRREAALAILEELQLRNPLGFPSRGGPDDRAAWEMLCWRYGPERVRQLTGIAAGWRFREEERTQAELEAFPVIHFGQRSLAKEAARGMPGVNHRGAVAAAMRAFLDQRDGPTR